MLQDQLATVQVLHWGFRRVADGLDQCTLPLALLPSVATAQARGKAVVCKAWPPTSANDAFPDWEAAAQAHKACCFVVRGGLVPWLCWSACACSYSSMLDCRDAVVACFL
jgi:hypothetical protein